MQVKVWVKVWGWNMPMKSVMLEECLALKQLILMTAETWIISAVIKFGIQDKEHYSSDIGQGENLEIHCFSFPGTILNSHAGMIWHIFCTQNEQCFHYKSNILIIVLYGQHDHKTDAFHLQNGLREMTIFLPKNCDKSTPLSI